MLSKAKVAVSSDIRTKHSTRNERHVEFLNVKPWWYVKKPLGVKRLMLLFPSTWARFWVGLHLRVTLAKVSLLYSRDALFHV